MSDLKGNARASMTNRRVWHWTAVLAIGVILALAAQAQASDSDVEATMAPTLWAQMALVASTGTESDFTPMPTLHVAPNKRMVIAFNYLEGGVQNPYYSEYNRSTATWGARRPIHTSSSDLRYVSFAFDTASRAHAVWRSGTDVYYAPESGWPNTAKKLPGNSEGIVDAPAIAIGPDNVIHVVWSQGDNLLTVYHAFSRDGGNNWTLSPAISPPAQDTGAVAAAVTTDGAIHLVWEVATFDASLPDTFRFAVYYRKGTPQGSSYSWNSSTSLSATLTGAKRPSLLADGNNLHLGFTQQDSKYIQYAYYRRFAAGGTWGPLININATTPVSVNTNNPYYLVMSLVVCGGNTHVFYHGAQFNQQEEQIWKASSANNWQGALPVTPLGERYIHPAVVCDGSMLALGVEQVRGQDVHEVRWTGEEKRALLPLVRGG